MSCIEDIKKEIDDAKTKSLFDYTFYLNKILNKAIIGNMVEQYGLIISEITKLYYEKKYHQNINWNTIFINCINSNEVQFLKILNTGKMEDLTDSKNIKTEIEETLPELKNLYFIKDINNLEKNNVIYDKCCRYYGTSEYFMKHIETCSKCKELKLNKKITIHSGEILDYLLKYTNSNLTYFKDNLKPTKSILTYIKDEVNNISFYKELLFDLFKSSNWFLEQKLEIGDQLEILNDFYESNSKESIKFTDYLIDKGYIELIKLFSDSIQLEDLCQIVSYSINHNKLDLYKYILIILKNESKTDKVLEIINELGNYINNLKSLKIYQEELGDFINKETYDLILKRESKKTNQDLEFIMELTKYDYIQNNFEDTRMIDISSDDEMMEIYQSFTEEIESNNIDSNKIETITLKCFGDIEPYNNSTTFQLDNLSFKIDDNIKNFIIDSLNTIAISL